ncbi:Small, acid-soluble spore protein H [Caldalkalibacillus thermarum TA2.A1]|uniref:Small, acid-soluble spore protein H n=1 Tax=Caldalkalibacillus thermarum (strain TA2.A1) TaxID=986075 RepID=F5L4R4_CALTT|nr:H-type small acid-soluble spore protein [Caldalkalibacillus thermarum]EGL83663.1 Small, acid-soluble spore protein H [Caldalkalibacillus thermarum TA2.A1]QZT34713.1 H-type small acid-soluble spore protein [Caldalkalibacillus thermarum TA2.A1]GGK31751.1 small, acid-soluble spore protein H [Caldalkalibacillus thermarum]
MNVGRAKQIVESTDEIVVLHHGEPIWIQRVDEERGTARIYPCDNPEQEREVPVEELVEKH